VISGGLRGGAGRCARPPLRWTLGAAASGGHAPRPPAACRCAGRCMHRAAVTSWNFLRNVSNAKMWISKFRFEIECLIKL
jgi:hypothetical protein